MIPIRFAAMVSIQTFGGDYSESSFAFQYPTSTVSQLSLAMVSVNAFFQAASRRADQTPAMPPFNNLPGECVALFAQYGIAQTIRAGGNFTGFAAEDFAPRLVEFALDAFVVLIINALASAFFHSGFDCHDILFFKDS